MSKKYTLLWREVHFEVKMLKTPGVRPTFGGSDVASLRFTTLHYIKQHYTTFPYATLHYTTLHYTTLHSLPLHFTTLHYTPLQLQLQLHNYTPLHSTTLHYITLHHTTLHYTTLHYTHSFSTPTLSMVSFAALIVVVPQDLLICTETN